jgi:hypothetical protein
MRVLVTGGRDYSDRATVFATLDGLDAEHCVDVVIHGAARGADSEAARWASVRGVPAWPNPADWSQGKAGGILRNQQMLTDTSPTHVVAFPGGRGTADMVRRARAANIPVIEVPTHVR